MMVARPDFALTGELRLMLRAMFLETYLEDPDFRADLIALAEGEGAPCAEIGRLCERWGITFEDRAAEAAIQWWATERRRAGPGFKPGWLISGLHASANLPDDMVAPPPADAFNPTTESREAARERILGEWSRHLDARLDAIAKEYAEAAGVQPRPQRRGETLRHMGWLYARRAYGTEYRAIAARENMAGTDAVRKACDRLARELGLTK